MDFNTVHCEEHTLPVIARRALPDAAIYLPLPPPHTLFPHFQLPPRIAGYKNVTHTLTAVIARRAQPDVVQDFYTNEQLISITRELTDALRTNKTNDWTMKESARAGMRRIVKRLLKKYKYPPEGQEAALETIMTQCEMWSKNEFDGNIL